MPSNQINTALTHERYLETIEIINSSETFADLFTQFIQHLEIKASSYHHFAGIGAFDFKKLNRYHAFNIPEKILEFYDGSSDHREDPGVYAVFEKGSSIWLSELATHPHIVKSGVDKVTQYALNAIGDGLCIPLYGTHNRTGYTFIGFERPKEEFTPIFSHQIRSLAQSLHVRYCLMVEGLQTQVNLTPRELEVLELISFGKSNPDIATILNISTNTVAGYVSRIFLKLGVSDRVSAAMRAGTINLKG